MRAVQGLKVETDFNKALVALYYRFYKQQASFSSVTSSHWQTVGWHQVFMVDGIDGVWKLRGAGFGDWRPDTVINNLRTFGVSRAIASMKSNYACPSDLWQLGTAVAKSQQRIFSYDCAKQILSLAKVVSSVSADDQKSPLTSAGIRNVCVIGDGYGYLGSLLKAFDPGVTVTSVNLGRGLLFDAYYTSLRFPEARVAIDGSLENPDFIFLPAEDYSSLQSMPQDLVFNIASMQEMNLAVVQNYVSYLRRSDRERTLFYCCNRVEKTLPDGELVRFAEYGWDADDSIVFDETCPWYQSYPQGLIPSWHPFDGEIKHRLAYLAPNRI